jgi:hypothetical protein
MVMPHVNLIRSKKLRHLTNFQARYASFRKIADLSPEASNAFKLPLFEISILKDKKRPRTFVQILSPGGTRGVCYVLPQGAHSQKTAR